MEVAVAIMSLIVGVVAAYLAYLQLKRTPKSQLLKQPQNMLQIAPGETGGDLSSEEKAPASNMESLIADLLPADILSLFNSHNLRAHTEDDAAGLSLIVEIIEKKAEREINVIGRGTQLVDAKTKQYLKAVAKAILRQIVYKRILILDPSFPQNSLLWLLFLERFLRSAKWRDFVCLYVKDSNSSNESLQFQIVDDKFLHRVARRINDDSGASPFAQSSFYMSPHEEVSQSRKIYQTRMLDAGNAYKHQDVVVLLTKMLHKLDSQKQNISYHWKLVLDVTEFLENLDVPDLPPRSIKFVGSLMPCTFTFEAAEKFVRHTNDNNGGERIIVLPFRRMEDAIQQFLAKRIDYLCVPIENSYVDQLMPPTVNGSSLDALKKTSREIYQIDLPVKFVLAGVYQKRVKWEHLIAVEAAYLQIKERLPKNAAKLTRGEIEVESNYHAAWLAKNDSMLVAITTAEAAQYLNLHIYSDMHLKSETNKTKFTVYSHSNEHISPTQSH